MLFFDHLFSDAVPTHIYLPIPSHRVPNTGHCTVLYCTALYTVLYCTVLPSGKAARLAGCHHGYRPQMEGDTRLAKLQCSTSILRYRVTRSESESCGLVLNQTTCLMHVYIALKL
jgi:hypothetical protein